MTYLTSLRIQNFRSYESASLSDLTNRNIILYGKNGVGKTNILEAISLLAPGRGLHTAKVTEMQNAGSNPAAGWVLSTEVITHFGPLKVGIGRDPKTEKILLRLNGEPAKTRSLLGEWLSCIWLTPQMDRLFLDDKSTRRRFFDRLVYTFDPAHMGRLTRYENAMRQRLKLLKDGQHDDTWLTGIESQIAETAIAIIAARQIFCDRLGQAYISATAEEKENFPVAFLSIKGEAEMLLEGISALEAEGHLSQKLSQNRHLDADSGTTRTGPHRSDFNVLYTDKKMPAAQCSTGEQKALLIGIILAHARLLEQERGDAPLLLLDEIVAHLDPNRRKILSDILEAYPSQVWMTGTDPNLFNEFQSHSELFEVAESSISPASFFNP